MEHRYCPRINESLCVSLWHAGEWWGTFPSENISLDGLFIRTSPMDKEDILSLKRNPLVRVCVECLGTRHCMSAFVVHRSARGLGLMLAPPDPVYTRWMLDMLNRQGLQQTPDPAYRNHTKHAPPAMVNGRSW